MLGIHRPMPDLERGQTRLRHELREYPLTFVFVQHVERVLRRIALELRRFHVADQLPRFRGYDEEDERG